VLVALVAFPPTWLALAWFDIGGDAIAEVASAITFPLTPVLGGLGGSRSGVLPSLLVFAAPPILGVAALSVVVEWGELRTAWRSWRTVLDRRGRLDELRALRQAVTEEVASASRGAPNQSVPPRPSSAQEPV
jgi:hypothetical protein